jgi:hypothetical protein
MTATDAALRKKALFNQERAERLKDPRQRVMGIDKHALDEQVKEKESLNRMEKDRNDYFDKQAMFMDKHAQVLQREVDEVRRQREVETKEFRDTFQRKDLSREWDLNNPKRVSSDLPARVCDDDPRCGPASLQRFEGEDLDARDRRIAQAQQQKRWVDQQQEEKLAKKWMEKEANRVYEDRAEEMAFRTWQIEQQVAAQRKQAHVTTADFNKAMAEQKRREKLQSRMRETQQNLEEIDNALNSDILQESEGPLQGRATQSTRFKGLAPEELKDITSTQRIQREQLEHRRRLEAEEERQLAQQSLLETRMGMALDRQRERERRDAAVKLGHERLLQAKEAADRKKKMNELYRNEIGEEYFVHGKCL